MSYIALYRKWRPKIFEDVVGQGRIMKTLQKAVENDKVAHAYLFSGPRGTGKTSTAKIFAKALNCVHGPTAHPCNECDICKHITSGESLDVVEIDAASNRSIEDIRQLRETVKFMPTEGHKKIYIIDEVHMLTTEAFNALLKTLEEPPAHVVFILATTEPERIPMTILSRCQRYDFRRITADDIQKRLAYIADKEEIDLKPEAARMIAVRADGGMRDALSLLDQCIGNGGRRVDEELVRELLGLVGKDWLFSMTAALFNGRGEALIDGIDEVVQAGKEVQHVLADMVMHLRALMLYQAAPKSETLAAYADVEKELAAQAESIEPARIFAVLNILQEALLRVKTSPYPRIAVETGLLMAAQNESGSGDLAVRVTALEKRAYTVPQAVMDRLVRLEQGMGSKSEVYVPPASKKTQVNKQEPKLQPAAAATVPEGMGVVKPAVGEPQPKAEGEQSKTPAVDMPSEERQVPVNDAEYNRVWSSVCAVLDRAKKKAVLSCIRNGRVVYIGETEFILALPTEFMVKRANREDYYTCVDEALAQVLGKGYHMRSYLEGDSELAAYEKKKTDSDIKTATIPQKDTEKESVLTEQVDGSHEPVAIERQDIPQGEREALSAVLDAVGDCRIFVEYKDT